MPIGKNGSATEYDTVEMILDGHKVQLASLEALQAGGACAFVWANEIEFVKDNKWKFNAAHAGEYEPLWIDPTTAGMLVKIYDALQKPENKAKFADWVSKDRGNFAYLVEMGWSRVKSA